MSEAKGKLSENQPEKFNFSGDENITRILDQLILGKTSIYRGTVVLSTSAGTFQGEIVSKGAQFVVIERDTNMQSMGSGGQKKIMSQQLVAVNSITAVTFEVLS